MFRSSIIFTLHKNFIKIERERFLNRWRQIWDVIYCSKETFQRFMNFCFAKYCHVTSCPSRPNESVVTIVLLYNQTIVNNCMIFVKKRCYHYIKLIFWDELKISNSKKISTLLKHWIFSKIAHLTCTAFISGSTVVSVYTLHPHLNKIVN